MSWKNTISRYFFPEYSRDDKLSVESTECALAGSETNVWLIKKNTFIDRTDNYSVLAEGLRSMVDWHIPVYMAAAVMYIEKSIFSFILSINHYNCLYSFRSTKRKFVWLPVNVRLLDSINFSSAHLYHFAVSSFYHFTISFKDCSPRLERTRKRLSDDQAQVQINQSRRIICKP